MKQPRRTIHQHVVNYWDKYWRIPDSAKPHVFNLVIMWAMLGLLLLWLALSAFRVDHRIIEILRPFLPRWFPIANLFIAPILAALVGGPLPIRPIWRLLFVTILLGSLSALYLSFWGHQLTTLIVTGLLYIEAFLLIPRWNKWTGSSVLTDRPVDGVTTVGSSTVKSRIADFAIYVGIAALIALVLVFYVLRRS